MDILFASDFCSMYNLPWTFVATGWRRLIGSPKLQIIFHKRATNYRALLRKMTYKDKGSHESSPPCSHTTVSIYNVANSVYCSVLPRVTVCGSVLQRVAVMLFFIVISLSHTQPHIRNTHPYQLPLHPPGTRTYPVCVQLKRLPFL